MKDKVNYLRIFWGVVVFAAFFFLFGFMIGKLKYDRPFEEKVERDTVIIHDTIPDYLPTPKDSAHIKWVTRWLPSKPDTITKWDYFVVHDSVAVEVPITSKHYGNEQYDAYISGFEPNLDSIFVYQKTEYITETITKVVKGSKHFFLDISGGCNYIPNTKSAVPFAELGIKFKTGKVGIGAYGGYSHDTKENKATPYAGIKASYDIISF